MTMFIDRNGEEKLLKAAKRATELVDDHHLCPTDAVAKVAMDMQLTPEMTRRVGEAYNTGRTTYQRETSKGILDKMAEFPLVDIDKVLAEMYPTDADPKTTKQASSVVDSCYSQKPAGLRFEDRFEKKNKPTVKAASAVPLPTVKRAKSLDTARIELDRVRTKVGQAEDVFINAIQRLGDYFSKLAHDRLPFGVVAHNVDIMYGDRGNAIMEYVQNATGLTREKEAADANGLSWRVFRNLPPYSIVEECIKVAGEIADLKKEFIDEYVEFAKVAGELYGKMRPKYAAATAEEIRAERTSVLRSPVLNKTALFGNVLGSALGAGAVHQMLAPTPPEKLIEGTSRRLSDPDHENQLRAIRSKALLTNMMSNDDVLSSYPMEDVVDAYNKLSTLGPRVALQPAAVQSFLRNYMSQGGHVPMFETMEAANLEKTLLQSEKGSHRE